ncbi:HDIG domain-containing metalloprotein [Dethiosulfatarculus sandiegensis]|uniref:Hydrolase n=1 Tax=Dethiosulfatarculus sandiegensis TaxID=1429043 RepID=A0A0D2GBC4_9BACT|nr:HDIG domain-containing metalloprotein [Dethiosulfatarculus sandiegensis]KIX12177.1 hydrolase [Dethiosulfatarculus sandiegensis]
MDYLEARALMERHLLDASMRKHSLASGAVLRALARRLGKDEEKWAVAGVLHDLDYEKAGKDGQMDKHGLLTVEMLEPYGLSEDVLDAIKAHNAENLGVERKTDLDLALTCGETVTGLVVATALVYPDKKLASVKPKSITKRMKQTAFARSVNRDHIRLCEKLDIPLSEFADLALNAMREISDDLGL